MLVACVLNWSLNLCCIVVGCLLHFKLCYRWLHLHFPPAAAAVELIVMLLNLNFHIAGADYIVMVVLI